MGEAAFSIGIKFHTMHCAECGMAFAVPEWYRDEKLDTGEGWCCPNGHSSVFTTPRLKALKNQLDREKQRREWAEQGRESARRERDSAKNSARSHKAAHTRTKNRIKAGVCPCCNRTFQNLARHMAGQHPGYAKIST